MSDTVSIRQDVRLVLVTGPPGSGKTRLGRELACRLPEQWRILRLDDFFVAWARLAGRSGDGNVWPAVQRAPQLAGETAGWFLKEGASIVMEGIIPGRDWAQQACRSAGLDISSPSVRMIALRCTRETAIARMTARHLKPAGPVDPGGHYDYLEPMSRVEGADAVATDGLDPERIVEQFLKIVNAESPPPKPI